MEYIKKEELIKGEVYRHDNGNLVQYLYDSNDTQIHGHFIGDERKVFKNYNDMISRFTIINLQLATPEEKHWLNSCISANKFITFEEAMKSFIPEYYEYINKIDTSWKFGKIYKLNDNKKLSFESGRECTFGDYHTSTHLFKPSTKEAYDAQFVIKEYEFVLPEKWCINIESKPIKVLNFFNENNNCNLYSRLTNEFKYLYFKGEFKSNHLIEGKVKLKEITLNQFLKYVLKEEVIEEKVIEPLPQFKVIETIETITKVENNEGSQFFIGDKVKSLNSNQRGKITKFKYSNDKSDIIAITTFQQTNGISINKIEHYIETKVIEPEFILPEKWYISINEDVDKSIRNWFNKQNKTTYYNTENLRFQYLAWKGIADSNHLTNIEREDHIKITFDQFKKYVLKSDEVKEETLLEKAKRLYPIGTKVNSLGGCQNQIIDNNTPFMNGENGIRFTLNCLVYLDGKWAEVIKYPHGFKIGDKIKIRTTGDLNIYKIINIEGNVLFYHTDNIHYKNHCRVLAKNAIKVN